MEGEKTAEVAKVRAEVAERDRRIENLETELVNANHLLAAARDKGKLKLAVWYIGSLLGTYCYSDL